HVGGRQVVVAGTPDRVLHARVAGASSHRRIAIDRLRERHPLLGARIVKTEVEVVPQLAAPAQITRQLEELKLLFALGGKPRQRLQLLLFFGLFGRLLGRALLFFVPARLRRGQAAGTRLAGHDLGGRQAGQAQREAQEQGEPHPRTSGRSRALRQQNFLERTVTDDERQGTVARPGGTGPRPGCADQGSSSSISPPPNARGCRKATLCPRAPGRGVSSMSGTPAALSAARASTIPST